jgi:RNA polymerase primary sigma factor
MPMPMPTVESEPELPPAPTSTGEEAGDNGGFDLSGWESEEEPARPKADLIVQDLASAIQSAITLHQPIDSSAGWDDIEAFLPEMALPLARADDAEGRALLRRLLLRAIREGSVPSLDVQAQSTNEDRSANPEAEAFLAMVVNDLGAEVDERFEYVDASESFEVFVAPEETPDEEASLDEALAAIDRAASPRHEPLRIYQREFQRLRLLTAEEEIQLAKEMEAKLDAAIEALAAWPAGLALTIAAGAEAVSGVRMLSSIWASGADADPEPATAESLEADAPAREEPEEATDDEGEPTDQPPTDAGDATFSDALHRLAAMVEEVEPQRASPEEIRQALSSLRLNRRFLIELIDESEGAAPCPAFARAMASFRIARDRMAAANLKLAFFHAKKYLYSGETLDDLAQEGNVGLLKAVDRYDWRRGFRFSTYATWWIRQRISRYVADKARTIRMPVHIHEKAQRAERIAQRFETATGRAPNLDELAERMEMPRHRLAALLRIAPEPSRIDESPVDELISTDARDALWLPDPADAVEAIQMKAEVDRYISSPSTKDRKEERILRLRYGIGIDEALTLEEVGQLFEVTRERIRQIEAKAIRKLKHPARSEPFARLVLGLEPEENPFAPGARQPEFADDADDRDAPETATRPEAPKRKAAAKPSREANQAAGSSKPSALDQLLAQAVELGIRVEDSRLTSGSVWVELLEPGDNTRRRLIRKLLDFGFAFWPGKGYWK